HVDGIGRVPAGPRPVTPVDDQPGCPLRLVRASAGPGDCREQDMRADLIRFLRRVPFFSGLPEELLQEVAPRLKQVELKNGDVLLRQGDPGDCLYVLMDGRVEARLEQRGAPPRVLGANGRGELVGEEAV